MNTPMMDDYLKLGVGQSALESAQARLRWMNDGGEGDKTLEDALLDVLGPFAALPVIAKRHGVPHMSEMPPLLPVKNAVSLADNSNLRGDMIKIFDGGFTIAGIDFERRRMTIAGRTPSVLDDAINRIGKDRLFSGAGAWSYDKALADAESIVDAYHFVFSDGRSELENVMEQLERAAAGGGAFDPAHLSEAVVRVFARAAYAGASDGALTSSQSSGLVKLKIDGLGVVERETSPEVIAAVIRVLAEFFAGKSENTISERPTEAFLDFSEKKGGGVPQHLQSALELGGKLIGDCRFRLQLAKPQPQTAPNSIGCFFRVLKKHSVNRSLNLLGFGRVMNVLKRKIKLPSGLVLFTGPTGSGKTTSADALLSTVDAAERWVTTIENPVEFHHDEFVQYEVRGGSADYVRVIKSLLRSNPDVVFFGECREREVAACLAELALTGSMVVSTLHASSAAGAVQRLREWGIDNGTIAEVLTAVVGQRLFPRLCDCALNVPSDAAERIRLPEEYSIDRTRLMSTNPAGCELCGGSGIRGRWLAYEVLPNSRQLHDLITAGQPPASFHPYLLYGEDIRTGIAAGMSNGAIDVHYGVDLLGGKEGNDAV